MSRTKIELFRECARCFYDDVALNQRRPSGPPFTLNNAVDTLLKAEFDLHRAAGTPHPIFATVGLEAIPLAHPQINDWRTNRTGVRWKDPVTDWTLYGAIDDAWETPTHTVLVADYKATARRDGVTEANLYPSYRHQVEVYQFLLEQQGLTVGSRAYFLYANGISSGRVFGSTLAFRTTLLSYDADRSWVLATFRAAVSLIVNGVRPPPTATCPWCQYVARASQGI
ncbi:MAG: PD-(D/E)XK nuclease family protein [Candidatus Nitrosopolaris sp.]